MVLNHCTPCCWDRSADCLLSPNGEMKVALLLQNNTVETYSLSMTEKSPQGTKTARLTLSGHRTDARTLAFSSDNIAVLSASGDTAKVWNRWGLVCVLHYSLELRSGAQSEVGLVGCSLLRPCIILKRTWPDSG